MTSARQRRMYRAGKRKDFAPLLGRQPSRNKRTTFERRLDHEDTNAQAANKTIPHRKVPRAWRRADGEFGNKRSAFDDRLCEFAMARRIEAIESRAGYGDRCARGGGESAAVRGA